MAYKCIISFRESQGKVHFTGDRISIEEFRSLRENEMKNFVLTSEFDYLIKEEKKEDKKEIHY